MSAGRSILFVEDDPIIRGTIATALRNRGYLVFERASAEEAMGSMERVVAPALIILDVDLPGASGVDMCRRLTAMQQKRAPILFLTASDDLQTLRACMSAGGDDFTIKSSPLSHILERVGFWVQRRGRGLPDKRRAAILDQIKALMEAEAERAKEEDPTFQQVIGRLATALDEAFATLPEGFGRTVGEKLYILGYVTGAVSRAADERLDLKIRFVDFLRAVVVAAKALSRSDTSQMLSNLDQLYADRVFQRAMADGAAFWDTTMVTGARPDSLADARGRMAAPSRSDAIL